MHSDRSRQKNRRGDCFLVIDMGNTTAHFGICNSKGILAHWRVLSNAASIRGEGLRSLKKMMRRYPALEGVLISSVVPKLNRAIASICRKADLKQIWLSHKTRTGIPLRYSKPREIGADRIANAAAARGIYGSPAIVVDIGTAITFDCISKAGAYLGGVIAPGPDLSRYALAERTGLLPCVDIRVPSTPIGKSTVHAIRSGIVLGARALIAGLVTSIQRQIGSRCKVIFTGGHAPMILKGWRYPGILDPLLTLNGLRIIYKRAVS